MTATTVGYSNYTALALADDQNPRRVVSAVKELQQATTSAVFYDSDGNVTFAHGPFIDVRAYGALDDGSDSAAAVQAAADEAVATGFPLYISGGFQVATTITLTGAVDVFGTGRSTSGLYTNSDIALLVVQASGTTLRDMGFTGSQTLSTTHATLEIQQAANNCLVEQCFFQGGRIAILNKGTDNLFLCNEARYAYGTAIVKSCLGGGGNFIKNKFDQQWPVNQPAGNYTINAWAATTAYLVGAIVSTSGFNIQCVTAGTSGGSAPTLLPYETAIIDGTAHWNIAMPTTYYSFQMDSGAQENVLHICDHSGAFTSCIAMTNTGDDGAGADPFFLLVRDDTCGQHMNFGLWLANGSKCVVTGTELGCGLASSDAAAVATGAGWGGHLRVTDNTIDGDNASGVGVALFGAFSNTIISNNIITGTLAHAINLDSGGGVITDFTITDNISDGTEIFIDTDVDWYIITDNNTHGGGVNDNGTGANKVVNDNL